MKKYCGAKLKDRIDKAVEEKEEVDGIVFPTRDELYEYTAEKLGVSKETTRKWCKPNSNGPKDPALLEALEKMFDTSLQIETDEIMQYTRYPDIVIANVVELVGDFMVFVNDSFLDDDEQYCRLEEKLHRFKPTIPPPLYSELDEFQKRFLSPFIFETKKVVPEAFSEKCGYWNEKKQFCVTDSKLHFSALFEKVEEIKRELDKIIESKVQPIIFS